MEVSGKYTMEGGKVKQGLYVGEIKEDGVEGALEGQVAEVTPLLELIKGRRTWASPASSSSWASPCPRPSSKRWTPTATAS